MLPYAPCVSTISSARAAQDDAGKHLPLFHPLPWPKPRRVLLQFPRENYGDRPPVPFLSLSRPEIPLSIAIQRMPSTSFSGCRGPVVAQSDTADSHGESNRMSWLQDNPGRIAVELLQYSRVGLATAHHGSELTMTIGRVSDCATNRTPAA